jgi:protein-S-isoprenylcysteine O-methyltransferase Ste14
MQATRLEFEQRFWFIGAIFFLGFSCSWLDHTNAAAGLIHLLAPTASEAETDRGVRIVFFAATGLLILAAMLRTWATAYLRADIVHDTAQHSSHIVADGPFRHVRNPLYLAAILMAAGIGTMASRLGWLVIVIGMTIFFYRLIFREEAGLLAAQGDSFRAYKSKIPRMIPSPWPRVPAGTTGPRWGQAIIGELFFWLLAAGMAAFGLTLDMRLAAITFLFSFAIYFAATAIVRKRARRSAP